MQTELRKDLEQIFKKHQIKKFKIELWSPDIVIVKTPQFNRPLYQELDDHFSALEIDLQWVKLND